MARTWLCAIMVLAVAVQQTTALNCLFLHGWGSPGPHKPTLNKAVDPNYVLSSKPALWGDLDVRVKGVCDRSVFYFTDTNTRGWNDAALQNEYCAVVEAQAADVIFAHSMANQILAAGIAAQLPGCKTIGRGPGQRHWYDLAGPMRGSEAATAGEKICQFAGPIGFLAKPMCKPKPGNPLVGTPTNSLLSLVPRNVPESLQKTASAYASGSMCGVRAGASGIKTQLKGAAKIIASKAGDVAISAVRDILSALYPRNKDWTARNAPSATKVPAYGADGVVTFESCRVAPLEAYTRDPRAQYYAFSGGHMDATCRSGDAVDKNKYPDFQPCSWVLNMAKRSREIKDGRGVHFEYNTTPQPMATVGVARFMEVDDEADDAAEEEMFDADQVQAMDESDDEDESESESEAEDEEEAEADADADVDMEDEDEGEAEAASDAEAEDEAEMESEDEVDAEAEAETTEEAEDATEFEAESEAEAEVELATADEAEVKLRSDDH